MYSEHMALRLPLRNAARRLLHMHAFRMIRSSPYLDHSRRSRRSTETPESTVVYSTVGFRRVERLPLIGRRTCIRSRAAAASLPPPRFARGSPARDPILAALADAAGFPSCAPVCIGLGRRFQALGRPMPPPLVLAEQIKAGKRMDRKAHSYNKWGVCINIEGCVDGLIPRREELPINADCGRSLTIALMNGLTGAR